MPRPNALRTRVLSFPAVLAGLLGVVSAYAGNADITDVQIESLGNGSYRIDTSVRHDDTGWEHYANRWDVLAPDGTLLGSRELLHPHVDEQPFTRSLVIAIPADIERVTLIANDSEHGSEGRRMEVDVPQ